MENPGVKSPLKDRQALTPLKPIHAPTGKELSCKGWHQEAALRMLMNSLDPAVTECREELITCGGTGRVARDWPSFYALVEALEKLENEESLLVRSGKPMGVFRTHRDAARVLIVDWNQAETPALALSLRSSVRRDTYWGAGRTVDSVPDPGCGGSETLGWRPCRQTCGFGRNGQDRRRNGSGSHAERRGISGH